MHRVPYDMTYSAFLLAQLQTGDYDACFQWLANSLTKKGLRLKIKRKSFDNFASQRTNRNFSDATNRGTQ